MEKVEIKKNSENQKTPTKKGASIISFFFNVNK